MAAGGFTDVRAEAIPTRVSEIGERNWGFNWEGMGEFWRAAKCIATDHIGFIEHVGRAPEAGVGACGNVLVLQGTWRPYALRGELSLALLNP